MLVGEIHNEFRCTQLTNSTFGIYVQKNYVELYQTYKHVLVISQTHMHELALCTSEAANRGTAFIGIHPYVHMSLSV